MKGRRPGDREARIIRTASLSFHYPAQLIRDAAALVPGWLPQFLDLFGFSDDRRAQSRLKIIFYSTPRESLAVEVALHCDDVPLMAAYMLEQRMGGMMLLSGPLNLTDSDGGEELPVPTISNAALAQMVPASSVVQ